MKKVLLVEDDPNKIKQIRFFFEEFKQVLPEFELEIQKSYHSGVHSILNNHFDLVLLDMSMPNFDKSINEGGGEFMKFAGEDILKEMDWNEIVVSTIVVTQYDMIGNKSLKELKEVWASEFPKNYIGTVYYSANESNWKSELLQLINSQIK